jgi:hypothetical protein
MCEETVAKLPSDRERSTPSTSHKRLQQISTRGGAAAAAEASSCVRPNLPCLRNISFLCQTYLTLLTQHFTYLHCKLQAGFACQDLFQPAQQSVLILIQTG